MSYNYCPIEPSHWSDGPDDELPHSPCRYCDGRGTVFWTNEDGSATVRGCVDCDGTGEVVDEA